MPRILRAFLPYALLVAAIVFLPFLPGLPGDFMLDDNINIVGNSGIELHSLHPAAVLDAAFSTQYGGIIRTLPTLTFALDYFRGGETLDPATFKITNIAIQALTALVLAYFLRSLLLVTGASQARARWAALAMALAWAVHPLQVSSVLYVVQRMQTLATLFIVLALWAYLQARAAQIAGRSGRTGLLLSGMLWAIALGCKEDAVLFPAYTLALELTVLRFHADNPALARRLRRGYLLATTLGATAFLFIIVPHYWSWDTIHNRNFSTSERLLTQGRVLCRYLWEILLPLPSNMPFYYDWLKPSQSILRPWTTLPALLLVLSLLCAAWKLRHSRPLFAFGIFLFFAGHFITSNVIALELAFEHRNHLPLIGIVLAVGDLAACIAGRLHLSPRLLATVTLLGLAGMASATALRAKSWNSDFNLAVTSTRIAPLSTRAWNQLCVAYFNLGGGERADNPYLDKAIAACDKGAEVEPNSIKTVVNSIAMKAIQGSLTPADWDRYLQRLQRITMTPENVSSIWVIINKARDGVPMDTDRLLEAIAITNQRRPFKPVESAAMGYFILGHSQHQDKAYPYFASAILGATDPAFEAGLIEEMRKEGRPDWADRLATLAAQKPKAN